MEVKGKTRLEPKTFFYQANLDDVFFASEFNLPKIRSVVNTFRRVNREILQLFFGEIFAGF